MHKRIQSRKPTARPIAAVPAAPSTHASAPALSAPQQARGAQGGDEPEMLTYQALARVTGIRVGTLYAMVCRGEIPHYRLAARIVRFSAAEIAAWMADRHQSTHEHAAQ